LARGESNHSNPFGERRRRASNDGPGGGAGAREERAAPVRPSSPMSRLVVGRAGRRRHVTVSDRRRDVTRAHGNAPRTRTHETYEAAASDSRNGVPPTDGYSCAGQGGGGLTGGRAMGGEERGSNE